MRALRFLLACMVLVVCQTLLTASSAQAAKLSLTSIRDVPQGYLIRPDWPTPNDAGQVFFLQRSTNPNTVVYAIQPQDAQASDDSTVAAYWRRYNTDGSIRALGFLERTQAFGVRMGTREGAAVRLKIRAVPQFDLRLKWQDGAPVLALMIDGRDFSLISAYLEIDEDALIPRARGLAIVARDLATGGHVRLDFAVAGGLLR
jgi:hypothetical protein